MCVLLLVSFSQVFAGPKFEVKTVVIDAGHGGKDPGAIGPGKTYEKDVALAVALKLGENIKKTYPGVKVIYTRSTDVFLELHERAEIANKNKADLFIAVHINSSTNPQAYGSSCYVLGLHKTEANLEVAKRENAVILLEDDRDKNYDFDPNTPEGHIIMSMKQNAFLDQSISIASKVETYMENSARRKSLGVKQAGFYVLYKTAMPSILAEIGFISNPDEEKYLKSETGQEKIADALFRAFTTYKAEMEGSEGEQFVMEEKKEEAKEPKKSDSQSTMEAAKNVVKDEPKKEEPKKEEPAIAKKEEPKKEVKTGDSGDEDNMGRPDGPPVAKKEEPKPDPNYITLPGGAKVRKPTESVSGGGKIPAKETAVVTPPVKKEEPKKEPEPVVKKEEPKKDEPVVKKEEPKKEPAPVVEKEEPKKEEQVVAKKEEPAVKKEEPKPVAATTSAVTFKIQLAALGGEFKDRAKMTQLLKEVTTEQLPNGLTRYYGGKATTYAAAQKLLETAKANGYATAFIVGFINGQRMNAEQMKTHMQ